MGEAILVEGTGRWSEREGVEMQPEESKDRGRISATAAALGMAILLMTFACAPVGSQDAPPDPTSRPRPPESRDYGRSDGRFTGIEARLAEISSRLDAQSAAVERVSDALEELSALLRRERGAHPGVDRDARAGKLLPEKNPRAIFSLRAWRSDPAVRARWMFSSAESVLEVMGTPDSIDTGGEHGEYVECEYWLPTRAGDDTRMWELSFLNGRLVDCDAPKE